MASQAVRAFAYGLGSVLLASTLAERFDSGLVGVFLSLVVAGIVGAQLVVARWADRLGRRRLYVLLYLALAINGILLALGAPFWLLAILALTGALSTEVIESGPFTSLEQAMLSGRMGGQALVTGLGWYNAIAAAMGALGAGATALIGALPDSASAPPDRVWFLVFVPAALTGLVAAARLSAEVEAPLLHPNTRSLGPSRPAVIRLSGLFALDSFAGGLVVQTFIAYWLIERLGSSIAAVGGLFAAIGVIQTVSFIGAPLVARRVGLLNTMVFTHLPSNLLLASVALAPSFSVAALLLLLRAALSQMDVPTRQAYVATMVGPEERTAAIAYTNTARYITRPLGPIAASAALTVGAGAPFLIAGLLKSLYDLVLWRWFRPASSPSQGS
jgi:MFS family permease